MTEIFSLNDVKVINSIKPHIDGMNSLSKHAGEYEH